MNQENKVRNFYEEEAAYEKTIVETKELVNNVLKIDMSAVMDKIDFLEASSKYKEFNDLFEAIVGRQTNKYYCCKNENYIKYYGLVYGEVYKMSELNPDIQSKNKNAIQLDLQSRAKLAERLYEMCLELLELFKNNVQKNDGSFMSSDSRFVKEMDIEDMKNIIKYLEKMMDPQGRLKILVAERDVFAFQQAKIDYNKKTAIEKWFHKTFKREQQVIDDMASRRK